MSSSNRFLRGLFFGSMVGAALVSFIMMRSTPRTKRVLRKRMRAMQLQARRARRTMEYGAQNLTDFYRMGRSRMERTLNSLS